MPLIVRGSGFAKLLASSGGITYSGGDVCLSKAGNAWAVNAAMLTDTKAVIVYSDAPTRNLYAMVADMSKPGKITCGKPTLIANHGVSPPNYSNNLHDSTEIVRMNDDTALVVYNKAPSNYALWYRYAIPLFISKTTITAGEGVRASSTVFNNNPKTAGLVNLADNKVLMVYTHQNPNRDCLAARTISISGGVLSFGTETVLSSVLWSGNNPRVDAASPALAFVCAGSKATSTSGAEYPYYYSLNIDEDEISASIIAKPRYEIPHIVLALSETLYLGVSYISTGTNRGTHLALYKPSSTGAIGISTIPASKSLIIPIKMSDTEIRLIYLDKDGKLMYLPLAYTATTLTPGTAVELTSSMLTAAKTVDDISYEPSLCFGAIKSTNFPLMTFWPNDDLQLMCCGEKAE